jgi:hypothetical protein
MEEGRRGGVEEGREGGKVGEEPAGRRMVRKRLGGTLLCRLQ